MANKNLFTQVQLNAPRRNTFDLTHDVKTTFDMGYLVPTMCLECIPGDSFRIGNDMLLRFMPLVSPVMHRFNVTCHYFFVPLRLLNPNFEKWIVNDPGALAAPTLTIGPGVYNELSDWLGIPPPVGGESEKVSAYPYAAFQFVYNEFYRDQNLVPPVQWELVPGDNSSNSDLKQLRRRAWEHDYFTSALPFAQKGNAVDIPLGTGLVEYDNPGGDSGTFRVPSAGDAFADGTVDNNLLDGTVMDGSGSTPPNTPVAYDPQGTLKVDVGNSTINDLRRAFRLQEWLERNARVGTRYTESILGHFGVKSDDARLQRPEYITGTKSPVIISEVLNNSGAGSRPQGDMAGHAVSVQQGHYGKYYCKEHGYIMCIMSCLPLPAYQQGIPRHFLKYQDPFKLAWPEFANIGEQEIENREIYAYQGTASEDIFGYTPRYAEYKYHPNTVHGNFRNTLDFWTASRIFAAPPALNQEFIECHREEVDRIFAVTTGDSRLLAQVLHKVTASRLLPKFGTPTF